MKMDSDDKTLTLSPVLKVTPLVSPPDPVLLHHVAQLFFSSKAFSYQFKTMRCKVTDPGVF